MAPQGAPHPLEREPAVHAARLQARLADARRAQVRQAIHDHLPDHAQRLHAVCARCRAGAARYEQHGSGEKQKQGGSKGDSHGLFPCIDPL